MATEYSWEVRDRARELYCIDGLTFEQVAEATGVSVSQLKRWSAEDEERGNGSWPDQKKEYYQTLSAIRRRTFLLRKELLGKALNSLDPQDVYAISSLEAAAAGASRSGPEPPPPVEITQEINTPAEAVAVLERAVERRLNIMLNQPDKISLVGIKEVKQCLELVEQMKAKYAGKETAMRKEGLSPATVKEIREKILGVGKE